MQDNNQETKSRIDLPSRCAHCDSTLEADEWHPTESIMRDGEVETILAFCDEECRTEWERQRTVSDGTPPFGDGEL